MEHLHTCHISASYLDCYLNIDNGKLITRLVVKRDDFNFPIVNFPFMSSNMPSAPAYGVYVSQLVRYAKKVQVGKDQEKAQSEKDSHSKNRGWKKPN